jgi:hypothetical protein
MLWRMEHSMSWKRGHLGIVVVMQHCDIPHEHARMFIELLNTGSSDALDRFFTWNAGI